MLWEFIQEVARQERAILSQRDIVVTIPKARLAEVEAEEAQVAERLAKGETDINYYWQMGRLPKECPRRIYFAWDGAVRAYHDVTGMDKGQKRIYMSPSINNLSEPDPIASFRGFRYYG